MKGTKTMTTKITWTDPQTREDLIDAYLAGLDEADLADATAMTLG